MVTHLQEIARLSDLSLGILVKIESSVHKKPAIEALTKIANVLDVKIDDLLY